MRLSVSIHQARVAAPFGLRVQNLFANRFVNNRSTDPAILNDPGVFVNAAMKESPAVIVGPETSRR